eukprot:9729628-Alexandrium_andersonii.AAC.1
MGGWSPILRKFYDTVRFLRGIPLGFVPTLCLYNILGVRQLSFALSFVPPPPEVEQAHAWTAQ